MLLPATDHVDHDANLAPASSVFKRGVHIDIA